jgi:hypothetical protein
LRGGHVAFNCPGGGNSKGKDKELNDNGKGVVVDLNEKHIIVERSESIALGTDLVTGPRHPSPPVFSSFGAWARSGASTSQAPPLPEPIIIQWTTPAPMTGGPLEAETHSSVTDLCLSSVPK